MPRPNGFPTVSRRREPGYDYRSDVTAIAGFYLKAWGEIPLNMPEIEANDSGSYSRAATLQRRVAGISALCSVHSNLQTTWKRVCL